jgi:plasmid stabilization system protein ParE
VSGAFAVRLTEAALADLHRLFDHLLERVQTEEELGTAQETVDALRAAVEIHLSRSPFLYRKAGDSPFLRELVVSFGRAGYVALFEIVNASTVHVAAIRHQLEVDYH